MGLFSKTEKEEGIICSECQKLNDKSKRYCECGHKLKTLSKNHYDYKTYCIICGKPVDEDDTFCGYCGYEIFKTIEKVKICPVCGEWMNHERFCQNCGHDRYNENISGIRNKKCPNCNKGHQTYYNYCTECGAKLIRK